MSEVKKPCGNEDCDKCYPLPRFKISTERVQRLFYEREIKAATEEEALRIYHEGTAWPSQYDDRYDAVLEKKAPVVTRLVSHRDDQNGCFHDIPDAERAAFLAAGNPDDDFR